MEDDQHLAWAEDRTDDVASRMEALREALAAERGRRRPEGFAPPGSDDGGGAPGEAPAEVVGLAALAAIVAEEAGRFLEPVNETCRTFEIVTPVRVAHFLAQTAHESALYTALVENLNYSARGLLATWPKRFDAARAEAYARQPERIADYVYADRMGNGPEGSGDGWRFRGRGVLQVTGRATYREVGKFLGVDLEADPDLLATPRYAALAAGWYWHARGINELCDMDDPVAVTEAVNGGRHGLEERVKLLGLAKAVLAPPPDLPA